MVPIGPQGGASWNENKLARFHIQWLPLRLLSYLLNRNRKKLLDPLDPVDLV